MEKVICNAPWGDAKTSRFARVFALIRKVAPRATLPAVLALVGTSGALTALGDGLPAEYQQLEYIKATGNCQVRTGVTPASTDKVEMRFRPDAVGATQNLWCSRDGSGTSHQFTAFLLDSKKVRFDRNEGAAAQITSTDTLLACTNYLVVADYGTLEAVVTNVADGAEVVNVTMASGDYTPGSDLCLFASHSTGPTAGLGNYGSYRLYSFKLSDASGTLRLDLVPAKRVEDGVVGLYDAKNDTFLTNSLSGTLLAGPAVLAFNSYVWVGGASGNLSDAANWSPAPAGAFTADDELVVNDAAEITVDAAATVGKLTLNAAGAVAFTGANALTVTRIANTGTDEVTFNCPVNFSGTYYVEQTGAVKFPGGATATYPDATLRTASTLDRTLDGTFTFTEDWIVNNVGDYPWIVASNSVVHGKNFSGTQISHHRILRVEETGYARFVNVTNGWDLGDIDIDGTLEVVNEMIVRTRPTSASSLSHFGREGNTGTVKAWRIAKCEHAIAQSFVPNLVVGAGGMGSLTQDYYWRFEVDTTITASDDFEFLGLPNGADWGIGVLPGKTLTIDTAGHTVTCGIGVQGAGALAKAGAGTLVMTNGCNGATGAVKEYSGGTAVNGGTLRVAADNSIGPGPVTVAEGARLEIADGLALSSKVEGEGTLAIAGDLTLADSGRLYIDACSFAEGAEVFVAKQSEYGVVASNVTQTAYETYFTSADGELSWADGTVSYSNGFVWVGADGGAWSDAGNWSFNGTVGMRAPTDDAYADVSFTNAATAVLDVPATIRNLSFTGAGAVKIVNPAATHGFVTTNRLALATVSNSATVMPEIECKVGFAETYKVVFENTAVKFAGGATATGWDTGNALGAPTSQLYGNFIFTAGWTIPTPNVNSTSSSHTLKSGSTMTCPTLTLPHHDTHNVNNTTFLYIESGSVVTCQTVLHKCGNDTWNNCRHAISVGCNGTLNVKTIYRLDGNEAGGRIGMYKHKGTNGCKATGILNLQGIEALTTGQTGWHTWLEQRRINIGASGIRVASGFNTKAFGFAHGMTVGAFADYVIRSERATPSMGLYGNTTFDTLDSADRTTPRTITITAKLTDLGQTHSNAQYPGIGQIIKVNPGRLVLSGDSTYSNGTKINGGTVRLEHNNAAGTGPITVAAGATLELADGVTIANAVTFADGATLVCGTGSQISGTVTRNGTVNLRLLGTTTIFPAGYTDTTGFVVTPDSAVGTLSVDGGALKYDARAIGTFTWTGAVDGNFSTPGNWSVNGEAVNDVPNVLDTIRFAPEAATTVTLDADAQVAAMVIEGAGALTLANPSAATTNTLTLASVTSSATVMPVINCKVQFTGKYTVSFTNKSVNFAGGATATTWDSANTAAAPTSEFYGNITFTEDWTVPNATDKKCYIRAGATVTCPTLILPFRNGSYLQLALLQIDAGGTLNCRKVLQKGSTNYYNGVGDGVTVYVNGQLNVTEDYEVLHSGRIGINKVGGAIEYYGNGLFCLEKLTVDDTANEWLALEQKKMAFGAGGIVVKWSDKYAHSLVIAPWVTFGSLADYSITSEKTDPKMGLYGDLTFDTQNATNAAVSHTVLVAVNLYDKAKDHQYQYGYPGKGSIIKKNAGTLILVGDNSYSNGTTVNGGTLLAAHDHALGTGAASVGAGGTLELMEGVSVTNAVTLAADATLLIDGVEARATAGTSVVGTIATPSTGTANLKVVGDLSEETQNISIMLGALAEGASVEALTLDATELTLPKAGWRTKLKVREGALMLDVKNSSGMTLIVR